MELVQEISSGNFNCSDEVHTKVLRSAVSLIHEYSGVSRALARQKIFCLLKVRACCRRCRRDGRNARRNFRLARRRRFVTPEFYGSPSRAELTQTVKQNRTPPGGDISVKTTSDGSVTREEADVAVKPRAADVRRRLQVPFHRCACRRTPTTRLSRPRLRRTESRLRKRQLQFAEWSLVASGGLLPPLEENTE